MRVPLVGLLARTALLAAALLLSPAGCDEGGPGCPAACSDLKATLETVHGCTVDCTASPWTEAKSCDTCLEAFQTTCQVNPLRPCFCQDYFGGTCDD